MNPSSIAARMGQGISVVARIKSATTDKLIRQHGMQRAYELEANRYARLVNTHRRAAEILKKSGDHAGARKANAAANGHRKQFLDIHDEAYPSHYTGLPHHTQTLAASHNQPNEHEVDEAVEHHRSK